MIYFILFFVHACSMWKFLVQGSNLSHSSDITKSVTCWVTRELLYHDLFNYSYSGLSNDSPDANVHSLIHGTCKCYLIWNKSLQMWLNEKSWDGEIILDDLGRSWVNHECPFKRKAPVWHTQRRRQCEDRGRNWSAVATSRGVPEALRSWETKGQITF